MTLRISGKQMEIGDAFRERIETRIGDAVTKYFGGGFSGRVAIEKNGSRFSADCTVSLDTGVSLQAAGQAQEPQAAFEVAAEHLDKRLRRYKRRLKSHSGAQQHAEDVAYSVFSSFDEEDGEAQAGDAEEDEGRYSPAVIAESSMPLRKMSVASAVIELDTKDDPVLIFRNGANDGVNVVYRRADGNIGWIDTAARPS